MKKKVAVIILILVICVITSCDGVSARKTIEILQSKENFISYCNDIETLISDNHLIYEKEVIDETKKYIIVYDIIIDENQSLYVRLNNKGKEERVLMELEAEIDSIEERGFLRIDIFLELSKKIMGKYPSEDYISNLISVKKEDIDISKKSEILFIRTEHLDKAHDWLIRYSLDNGLKFESKVRETLLVDGLSKFGTLEADRQSR